VVTEGGLRCRIRRKRRNHQVSETRRALIGLGLDGLLSTAKFIPEAYLLALAAARLELLRGLVDTEGTVLAWGRTIRVKSSSPALAEGIIFLARSLGAVVSVRVGVPTYTYRGERSQGQPSTRMILDFRDGTVPASSAKHLARWRGRVPRAITARSRRSSRSARRPASPSRSTPPAG
jgi:hypothetical protein